MSNPFASSEKSAFPAPGAAASLPPSTSTLSMSPDRGLLGKIVGHLYIAAKILIEGRVRPIEQVRHEIRTMMYNAGPETASAATSAVSGSAGPAGSVSLHSWQNLVIRTLRQTGGVPTTITSLPDEIKKELAALIKQGKTLCSASNDATRHLTKAGQQYLKLSGVSYL